MDNTLVSIVICCHNRAHLLPQTLASVFAQHYQPVEIVVVDDGSTDGTAELMAGYGDRVRYYRHENRGTPYTRTRGCELARGEWIAFQDDDDLMAPERICVLYDALKKYPSARFAAGDWAVIDQEGKLTGERSRHKIGKQPGEPVLIEDGYTAVLWPVVSPIPHTTLFRKSDGEKIGWFDLRFHESIEDADFFARIGNLGPVVYVPEIVSFYRVGHSQKMGRTFINAYNRLMLFDKHLRQLDPGQIDLKERLQMRLFGSLKRMAILQARGIRIPEGVSVDVINSGISQLNVYDKIRYRLLTRVKLPLRKVLARSPRLSRMFLNQT